MDTLILTRPDDCFAKGLEREGSDRRGREPPEDHQAADVWPRQLRSVANPRALRITTCTKRVQEPLNPRITFGWDTARQTVKTLDRPDRLLAGSPCCPVHS